MHRFTGPSCRFADELANAIPAEVVAVDYSVSPEAAAGVAIRECFEVWKAVSAGGRFAVVGGDSAGGGPTSSLMFTILESGHTKTPDGMFLIDPTAELRDNSSISMNRFSHGQSGQSWPILAISAILAISTILAISAIWAISANIGKWQTFAEIVEIGRHLQIFEEILEIGRHLQTIADFCRDCRNWQTFADI
jgi:hypothetical protein